MIFMGILAGIACQGLVPYLLEGPQAVKDKPIQFTGWLFWCGAIVVATLIGVLQYFRIVWSRKRTSSLEKQYLVTSFFSVHTNLQMLSILCMGSIAFIAWVIGWWIHSDR